MTTEVYIGIGSNIDNPMGQVMAAVTALNELSNTKLIAVSPWYQSAPIGPSQPDFINGVAMLQTNDSPEQLLDKLQAIEHAQGRRRQQHWGPRTLDLDILLWGNETIHSERLTIPHAFLKERSFVIIPLMDLAPTLTLPCGTALYTLAESCDQSGLKRLAANTDKEINV